ncbi:MAG: class I SAM-dependent methyltransferase, partial [Phycisphaerales bacterium]|nr:class I SAM-dependent methyltransferase [Phycisphaerales bacterium]
VTTTTISQQQHDAARRRIDAAGLAHRITLVKADYRDLTGSFDKLVSIEMVEAVGRDNITRFFKTCSDRLKPHGAAFIQAITIRDQYFRSAARTRDFLKKYIFPGSCLLSSNAILQATTAATDLRLWSMTDIAPHYATTLQHWRSAFNSRLPQVKALGFDDRFIRMWDFYFAYCEGAFRARHVGDVQMLLTKPLCRLAATGLDFTAPAPDGTDPQPSPPAHTLRTHTPASRGSQA